MLKHDEFALAGGGAVPKKPRHDAAERKEKKKRKEKKGKKKRKGKGKEKKKRKGKGRKGKMVRQSATMHTQPWRHRALWGMEGKRAV